MKYRCSVCGYIYDEEIGIPNTKILAGTRWEQLSSQWSCPKFKALKQKFIRFQSVIKLPMKTSEPNMIKAAI